ncbi:DUF488 family protein [Curtobacterium flaccumfaciens]|uniref:DUF488 domain-containing protein n=1 Tax=Curtobacterium flaccumfaciens TaxID=2035 RepID=UPI002175D0A8|nr:DUF488 domain-containing protein [Curtobacterium flaccumfaciens]MCS5495278.1 DUF488 domain-containing protein [Curtobacterium flaccumfaciens pv. flaccumfaciens]
MWTDTSGIIGVGYEGRTIEEFVRGLQSWGVSTLVDVRLTPLSRKPGFSKKRLDAALGQVGIEYLHRPSLGNPKDNRAGFGEYDSPSGREARTKYAEVLDSDEAKATVAELAGLAEVTHVAVLCFEASELHCHRKLVLDAVRAALLERTP